VHEAGGEGDDGLEDIGGDEEAVALAPAPCPLATVPLLRSYSCMWYLR
jgi:hypothetical protein